MASRAFFDPTTALFLSPLVSSTCTLLFAWDQHLFLRIFVRPSCRPHGDAILPSYFKHFFSDGLPQVLGFVGATFGASLGCIWAARPLLESRGSVAWYGASAALAAGHLLYAPAIAPRINTIIEGDSKKKDNETTNVKVLEEWLWLNKARMLTTDLGAWVCCVIAVTKTLSG